MNLADLLTAAIERRRPLLARLHEEGTDCVRLLHGVAEDAPGVTVDRYGPILLVQTWRAPLADGEADDLPDLLAYLAGGELPARLRYDGFDD